MTSSIYWIENPHALRLGIMARPRAGDWLADEIEAWRRERIRLVVSLLEPEETSELALAEEAPLCRSAGIDFIAFPIPDRGVPASMEAARQLAETLRTRGADGDAVAIHCRAGIGGSSLVAGATLIVCGLDAGKAINAIAHARALDVPDTDEQRDWLEAFQRQIAND